MEMVGLDAVLSTVRSMGLELKGPKVRRALYQGAVVVRDAARARVQVRTGSLKKAIVAESRQSKRNKKTKNVPENPFYAIVKTAKVAFEAPPDQQSLETVPGQKQLAPIKLKSVDRRTSSGGKKSGRRYNRGDIYPRNYDHLVEFGTKPHDLHKNTKHRPKIHSGARAKPYMKPAYFAAMPTAQKVIEAAIVSVAMGVKPVKLRRTA